MGLRRCYWTCKWLWWLGHRRRPKGIYIDLSYSCTVTSKKCLSRLDRKLFQLSSTLLLTFFIFDLVTLTLNSYNTCCRKYFCLKFCMAKPYWTLLQHLNFQPKLPTSAGDMAFRKLAETFGTVQPSYITTMLCNNIGNISCFRKKNFLVPAIF